MRVWAVLYLHLVVRNFFILAIWVGLYWYFIIVLICIFLITDEYKQHLFIHLYKIICFSSIVSCLSISLCVRAKLLQLCLTLCHPVDYSPRGFSVHGILQARILEWVAMPSSRGSSWPRGQTCIFCGSCIAGGLFIAEPLGRPSFQWIIMPF